MARRNILVLPGGGVKGMMQSAALAAMEKRLIHSGAVKYSIMEMFDMVVGVSVGSINGAMLCTHIVNAQEAHEIFTNTVKKVFKSSILSVFSRSKYSRTGIHDAFADLYKRAGYAPMQMKQLVTDLMIVAVSKVDNLPHYFKSWEQKDGELLLLDAVDRSYAAPFFFGPVVDEAGQQVWFDGGTGLDNMPLLETHYEIMHRGWQDDDIHIVTVGTGFTDGTFSFKEAKGGNKLTDILFFNDPDDGGLARKQARAVSLAYFNRLTELVLHNTTHQYIDSIIPANADKMDALEMVPYYEMRGETSGVCADVVRLCANRASNTPQS